jgi:hypothetical protein
VATEWQPVPAPGDEVPAPEQPSVPQQPAPPSSRSPQPPGVPQQAGERAAGERAGGERAGGERPAGERADAYEPSPPPSYSPAEEPSARRLASHPVVGFIPWILFWVIGGPSTWETATIAALIAALLVMALSLDLQPLVAWSTAQPGPPSPGPPSAASRSAASAPAGPARRPSRFRAQASHIKLLDVATVVFFAALTIAAIVTSRADVAELDKYSQAISSGALGIIALGSIVFGHPFTVDYAKEEAPPQAWHTAAFKRINLVLTSVWTVVFLVCGALGLIAQTVGPKGLRDWLNWYIPIVLIFIAFRFTTWYPQQVRQQRLQSARGPGPGR